MYSKTIQPLLAIPRVIIIFNSGVDMSVDLNDRTSSIYLKNGVDRPSHIVHSLSRKMLSINSILAEFYLNANTFIILYFILFSDIYCLRYTV